jgi:hypothetical protein
MQRFIALNVYTASVLKLYMNSALTVYRSMTLTMYIWAYKCRIDRRIFGVYLAAETNV